MTIEDKFEKNRPTLEWLRTIVHGELSTSPAIVEFVHSVKSRIKSKDHLVEKVERKNGGGRNITEENLFSEVTDLVGVRVLILFPQHFKNIHAFIKYMVESKKWKFIEDPIAYTWDDDLRKFFDSVGIKNTEPKDSKETLYTSVHYVIKIDNNEDDAPCCEIQVRTLLEEVFGEIDHKINYPKRCDDDVMRNLLKTLSKHVASGVKLSETILMHKDHIERME